MKSKICHFAFFILLSACNFAPNSNLKTTAKQEIKPKQVVSSTEDLETSNKAFNPNFENEILTLEKFKMPHLSLDSTHEYGAGDCFGKITYYSRSNVGLGIDSMSCGEYGYTNTHYLLDSKKAIQAIYLKQSESLLQPDGNWKYVLTERLIDFRNTQVTVLERIDTLDDHTKNIINKEFAVKKLKDGQPSLRQWTKEFREIWEKE